MSTTAPPALTPRGFPLYEAAQVLAGGVSQTASAGVGEIDGRRVAWFGIGGGAHRGSIGEREGVVMERAVRAGSELGIPIVGTLATSGAEVGEGVTALHAWGRVAKGLADASGVVPIVLVVTGPCVSGPAMLLGLADHVVMTPDAFAYVSGPEAVARMTGVWSDDRFLGGTEVHTSRTGLASLAVADEAAALEAVADLLSFLPSNHLEDPLPAPVEDPLDRVCARAEAAVPARATASYDVRDVVTDVMDEGTFLEVCPGWAGNMVTGYARLGGQSVGVIANQPCRRAGTIDIAAAQKAARFVQSCDAFNLALLTFVDTPGFEPGKDLEWRGMIRHGAQLVHAYAEATVPRLCVVLRKAYGGAYIVMDSRGMGNDFCIAWPRAELAVMGTEGAVSVLFGRRLAALDTAALDTAALDDTEDAGDAGDARDAGGAGDAERVRLEAEYAERFLTPWPAAERGLVDEVVDPGQTRAVLARVLPQLRTKRETGPRRRHSNSPL